MSFRESVFITESKPILGICEIHIPYAIVSLVTALKGYELKKKKKKDHKSTCVKYQTRAEISVYRIRNEWPAI